ALQAAPVLLRCAPRVRKSHRRTNRHPATTTLRAPPGAAPADVQGLWSPPRCSTKSAFRVLEVGPLLRRRRLPATPLAARSTVLRSRARICCLDRSTRLDDRGSRTLATHASAGSARDCPSRTRWRVPTSDAVSAAIAY